MIRIRRHLTYANMMATLAVFIALGGAAVASVIITNNSQVDRGTISGHHPPSGDHPNIIGRSIAANDLSAGLTSSLTAHCPSGYTHAAHADLCFEFNLRPGATYVNALSTCAGAGGHLPNPGELAVAFDNLGVPQTNQWVADYWFFGTSSDPVGGMLNENDSRVIELNGEDPTLKVPYRCVSYPSD
jgi:hypothetical protein